MISFRTDKLSGGGAECDTEGLQWFLLPRSAWPAPAGAALNPVFERAEPRQDYGLESGRRGWSWRRCGGEGGGKPLNPCIWWSVQITHAGRTRFTTPPSPSPPPPPPPPHPTRLWAASVDEPWGLEGSGLWVPTSKLLLLLLNSPKTFLPLNCPLNCF